MTQSEAETLLQRLSLLPFSTQYQKEQEGALVALVIRCTGAQEKFVRDILDVLGASRTDTTEV
jgi:hypothetical protein